MMAQEDLYYTTICVTSSSQITQVDVNETAVPSATTGNHMLVDKYIVQTLRKPVAHRNY
jgi:hypothetical protein